MLYHFGIVRPNAIRWLWKNLIWRIFFFNIQRPPPLDFQKRFLQCRGVIFQKKKFCVFGSLSNMSKNALLSASGWNPKLHNYHPCLPGPLSWLVDNLATMSIGASVLPIRSPYYNFIYQNDNNKHIFSQSEEALQVCDVQIIPKLCV